MGVDVKLGVWLFKVETGWQELVLRASAVLIKFRHPSSGVQMNIRLDGNRGRSFVSVLARNA